MSPMTYTFEVADKKTGKAVRIITEKVEIPQKVMDEMRRRVLGVSMAQKFAARRGALQATPKKTK